MFVEFLSNANSAVHAKWQAIMPGVRVCRFKISQPEEGFPISFAPTLDPLHFEGLFCLSGTLMIGRAHGAPLTAVKQEILLLSDDRTLRSAQIVSPFEGILVAVDGAAARRSLKTLCRLLGDLKFYTEQLKEIMEEQDGCILLRGTSWNRSVFTAIPELPDAEQGKYCVLKTLELLYLLCTQSSQLESCTDELCRDSYLTRTVADMQAYMENHLEEKLTIETLSRQFHISPTAFKSCFRRLNGQPVHKWLQAQRLRHAADLLCSSPMTILQTAQAIGYEGVSQFNVAFKRQFGITPRQYRKMSESGNL